MTREMNSGLSAEGESVAYPFNADNQVQPEWGQKYYWQRVDYDVYIGSQRKLDDWIKPYIDELNKRLENKQ